MITYTITVRRVLEAGGRTATAIHMEVNGKPADPFEAQLANLLTGGIKHCVKTAGQMATASEPGATFLEGGTALDAIRRAVTIEESKRN